MTNKKKKTDDDLCEDNETINSNGEGNPNPPGDDDDDVPGS